MWFLINWKKIAVLLTPTFLRGKIMAAWLELIINPAEDIHYNWMLFRKDNIYNLAHNSQLCYMEGALNDNFDTTQRRIYIDNGNAFKRKYIYTDGELSGEIINNEIFITPTFLGTVYLYGDEDYADTGVDFIVVIPLNLVYSPYKMRALIDFYKLASKRYKIVPQ